MFKRESDKSYDGVFSLDFININFEVSSY